MSRAWKTAVFILLLALGIALLVQLRTPTKSGPSLPVTIAAAQELHTLDLAEFYDRDPSFDAPGCWQAVPRGVQTLAGIPFRIEGLIQLWGEGPAGIGRNYRESVEAIPVKRKFQTLYVLHGSSFAGTKGMPIAQVVFRYHDGSSATNSIRFATDTRDWWEPLAEHDPLPTDSLSKVVWRGDHPSLPDWVRSLRLFGASIPNPKPEAEVTAIDLLSTRSHPAWVVLAMTTGPAGALKLDPQLERDELPAEEMNLSVVALDTTSGQPVPDIRFRVMLLTGRRPTLYGVFGADDQGRALINLPPEHIKQVSIEAFAKNYTSEQMSWNVEKGERVPTNYVFKASKEAP